MYHFLLPITCLFNLDETNEKYPDALWTMGCHAIEGMWGNLTGDTESSNEESLGRLLPESFPNL